MTYRDVGEWLVFLAAVITALAVIWRNAIRPVVKGIQNVERTLDAARRELIPNGGSSLRDAVDRIEAKQHTMERRVEAVETALLSRPSPRRKAPQ